MKQNSRLRPQEDQTQAGRHGHEQKSAQTPLEFGSPEALLRHDAAQNPAPPAVGDRLRATLADEPPPRPGSWWRRLFGR